MRRFAAVDATKKSISRATLAFSGTMGLGSSSMSKFTSPFFFFPFRYWPSRAATKN
jgi:hypothetical protein